MPTGETSTRAATRIHFLWTGGVNGRFPASSGALSHRSLPLLHRSGTAPMATDDCTRKEIPKHEEPCAFLSLSPCSPFPSSSPAAPTYFTGNRMVFIVSSSVACSAGPGNHPLRPPRPSLLAWTSCRGDSRIHLDPAEWPRCEPAAWVDAGVLAARRIRELERSSRTRSAIRRAGRSLSRGGKFARARNSTTGHLTRPSIDPFYRGAALLE